MENHGQLTMMRSLESLPQIDAPAGCGLRTYTAGDEVHWARIMNDCIGHNWTAERCLRELVNREGFRPDGCFFATMDGIPQGTATSWLIPELVSQGTGYVHMVGVATAWRGHGLGRLVSLRTLQWFHEHDLERAMLHTDDWRLPAIALYLKLGFTPVLLDEGHAHRWSEVRKKLADRTNHNNNQQSGNLNLHHLS